jgi:hypothetical protein
MGLFEHADVFFYICNKVEIAKLVKLLNKKE